MPAVSLLFEGHSAALPFSYFKLNQRKIQHLESKETLETIRFLLKVSIVIRIRATLLNMAYKTVVSVYNATLFKFFSLSPNLLFSPTGHRCISQLCYTPSLPRGMCVPAAAPPLPLSELCPTSHSDLTFPCRGNSHPPHPG